MTVYASTFATIKAAVIAAVRLDATADDTRAGEWVNQVYLDVAATTQYFEGSAAGAALAASASSQTIPTTVIAPGYLTCTYGGQAPLMREVPFDQILMFRSTNTSAAGPPQVYAINKTTLEFWPSAIGGEVITYYGTIYPAILTGVLVPDMPEPYASKLLEAGASREAANFKNDARLYFYYQGEYERWMGKFQAFLNRTEQGRAFPIYGPDGRPFNSPAVPHDPSSDFFVTGWR